LFAKLKKDLAKLTNFQVSSLGLDLGFFVEASVWKF